MEASACSLKPGGRFPAWGRSLEELKSWARSIHGPSVAVAASEIASSALKNFNGLTFADLFQPFSGNTLKARFELLREIAGVDPSSPFYKTFQTERDNHLENLKLGNNSHFNSFGTSRDLPFEIDDFFNLEEANKILLESVSGNLPFKFSQPVSKDKLKDEIQNQKPPKISVTFRNINLFESDKAADNSESVDEPTSEMFFNDPTNVSALLEIIEQYKPRAYPNYKVSISNIKDILKDASSQFIPSNVLEFHETTNLALPRNEHQFEETKKITISPPMSSGWQPVLVWEQHVASLIELLSFLLPLHPAAVPLSLILVVSPNEQNGTKEAFKVLLAKAMKHSSIRQFTELCPLFQIPVIYLIYDDPLASKNSKFSINNFKDNFPIENPSPENGCYVLHMKNSYVANNSRVANPILQTLFQRNLQSNIWSLVYQQDLPNASAGKSTTSPLPLKKDDLSTISIFHTSCDVPKNLAKSLTWTEVSSVYYFIKNCFCPFVSNSVSEAIIQAESSSLIMKKSFRSAVKYFFGVGKSKSSPGIKNENSSVGASGTDSSPGSASINRALSQRPDLIYLKRIAELQFFVGNFSSAAQVYKSLLGEIKAVKANPAIIAMCQENHGLSSFLSGSNKKECESIFDSAYQIQEKYGLCWTMYLNKIMIARILETTDPKEHSGKSGRTQKQIQIYSTVLSDILGKITRMTSTNENETKIPSAELLNRYLALLRAMHLEQIALSYSRNNNRKASFYDVLASVSFNKNKLRSTSYASNFNTVCFFTHMSGCRHPLSWEMTSVAPSSAISCTYWIHVLEHLHFTAARQAFACNLLFDSLTQFVLLFNSIAHAKEYNLPGNRTRVTDQLLARESTYMKELLHVWQRWRQERDISKDVTKNAINESKIEHISLRLPVVVHFGEKNSYCVVDRFFGRRMIFEGQGSEVSNPIIPSFGRKRAYLDLARELFFVTKKTMALPLGSLDENEIMHLEFASYSQAYYKSTKSQTIKPQHRQLVLDWKMNEIPCDLFSYKYKKRFVQIGSKIKFQFLFSNPLVLDLDCFDVKPEVICTSVDPSATGQNISRHDGPIDVSPLEVRLKANETKLISLSFIPRTTGILEVCALVWKLFGLVDCVCPIKFFGLTYRKTYYIKCFSLTSFVFYYQLTNLD
eukprot:GHVP01055331.1.p1 GENE.GHVP01055331.1~~GHVP01055331.1.p1  ORF type:complete len:1149 (+),score=199.41 GHVP01055331.1:46-3492(+)